MSTEAPLRVNNCIKPGIPQPEPTSLPQETIIIVPQAETLYNQSLSAVLSGERKADRGSRGLRRGRGSRRSRCSRCSGRHRSFSSQCKGGTPGLNQLVKITSFPQKKTT